MRALTYCIGWAVRCKRTITLCRPIPMTCMISKGSTDLNCTKNVACKENITANIAMGFKFEYFPKHGQGMHVHHAPAFLGGFDRELRIASTSAEPFLPSFWPELFC